MTVSALYPVRPRFQDMHKYVLGLEAVHRVMAERARQAKSSQH